VNPLRLRRGVRRGRQAPPDAGGAAAGGAPAAPVDGHEVLERLASLPVGTWRYRWEPEHVRHLGPMAQDWHAAFGLGGRDTVIPLVDAHGVTVVAIQALYHRVVDLERRLADLASHPDPHPPVAD